MGRQKLITNEILKNTPELGGQDGLWGEAIAYAKFFIPTRNWTWYMTEYDPKTKMAFGYVEGLENEIGPFSLNELEEMNDKFFNNPHPSLSDVWVERDQYFKPTKLKDINPEKFMVEEKENAKGQNFVKDWYINVFPDDELGERINPHITFDEFREGLEKGYDVYRLLAVGDSVVRERVFSELADRLGVDYDAVYNQWMKEAPGKIIHDKIERDPNQKYINFHMFIDSPYKHGPGWGDTDLEIRESVHNTLNHSCLIDTNMILVEKQSSGSCPSAYNPDDEMEEVYIHPMEITGTLKEETIKQIEQNIINDNNPNVKINQTKYFGECQYETPESYYNKLENLSEDAKLRLKQTFENKYGVEGNILGNIKYYLKDCSELIIKDYCFCDNDMAKNMSNVSDICYAWCKNLYENTSESQEALNSVLKKNNVKINNDKYAEPKRDAVKDSQNLIATSENKNIKNPQK